MNRYRVDLIGWTEDDDWMHGGSPSYVTDKWVEAPTGELAEDLARALFRIEHFESRLQMTEAHAEEVTA